MNLLKDPSTRNIIQLALSFFTNFVAFNTQGFIEEAVIDSASQDGSINKHAGYHSLAIIYAFYTIGNLTSAQIVNLISAKWAMCIGVLTYAHFHASFLFLDQSYLYFASALLGFGASILWTGEGAYLSQNSTKETASRNSAIVWSIHESALIIGGLMLLLVFSLTDTHDGIPRTTIKILYTTFAILSLISAMIFACLKTPTYIENTKKHSFTKLLGSTFRLFCTKKMLILVFVFSYAGIEQAFWTGIYPTAISFTRKLGYNTNALLAINQICTGIGQVAAGSILGIFGDKARKLGRDYLIIFGTIIHIIAYILCYINYPHDASLHKTELSGALIEPNLSISLFIGILLGFADACWNTQIMSILCDIFSEKGAQAFAIFRFYESLLSCVTFYYSSVVSFHVLLLFLTIFAVIAAICFFIVERFLSRKDAVAIIENKTETRFQILE